MEIRNFFVVRVIGFLVVAVALVGALFLFNNYIYQEKQGVETAAESYRATLEGEYVCLLYKAGATGTRCEPGLKTNSGEYYAVDFQMMTETTPVLELAQKFSANGTVTTVEALSSYKWQQYEMEGIFSVTDSLVVVPHEAGAYACTKEAKACPDGSYVAIQGPGCEFAACPVVEETLTLVTTALGDSAIAMGVTVSPQAIISDSRCLADVECIRAGTVEVSTTITSTVEHGENVLTLGVPQTFGDYTVSLVEVSPAKTQADIPPTDYRFTYEVSR